MLIDIGFDQNSWIRIRFCGSGFLKIGPIGSGFAPSVRPAFWWLWRGFSLPPVTSCWSLHPHRRPPRRRRQRRCLLPRGPLIHPRMLAKSSPGFASSFLARLARLTVPSPTARRSLTMRFRE